MDDLSTGGLTAWTDIGDASGDTTIAFGAHETDFTSTIDAAGEAVITITNTDADAANDNSFLDLRHNDGADANVFYARFIGDNDGTPSNDYLFSQTAFTTASGVAVSHTGTTTLAALAGTIDAGGATSFELPNAAGTSTLSAGGQIAVNTTDKQIGVHNGTKEVALGLVYHNTWIFDPDAICDGAVDRVFLMTIGPDAPKGITIVRWNVSFEADPTTEVDLDLKRADAFIGVANSAVMDVLDTTAGASSETTAANINGGSVVANGKVIYLEFGTAYTESNHQIIFEMWWEVEED